MGKKKGKKAKEPDEPLPTRLDYELDIQNLNRILAEARANTKVFLNRNEIIESENAIILKDRKQTKQYIDKQRAFRKTQNEQLNKDITINTKEFVIQKKEAADEFKIKSNTCARWRSILESDIRILKGKIEILGKDREKMKILTENQVEFQQKAFGQQERYRKEIYDKEREIVISKYELAQEVDRKINILVASYENTIKLRTATHLRKLVCENIAVNRRMDCLLEKNLNLMKIEEPHVAINNAAYLNFEVVHYENEKLRSVGADQQRIIQSIESILDFKHSKLAVNRNAKNTLYYQKKTLSEKEMEMQKIIQKIHDCETLQHKYKSNIKCKELKVSHFENDNELLKEFFQKVYNIVYCNSKYKKLHAFLFLENETN